MTYNFWLTLGVGWILFFGLLAVWTLAWKGMSLWKSARHSHKIWFVVLLTTNTFGILDILYIYFFSKKSKPVVKLDHK